MLRDAYLAWTRRALLAVLAPVVLTAIVQAASATSWWQRGPEAPLGVRSLFIAVGVASVAFGRGIRQREVADRPLTVPRLVSLSWKLVFTAIAPSVVGTSLALMTRSVLDFYLLLVVTLIGFVALYPRFDQWERWATPEGGGQ
jgi:hypothetical protein